MYVGVGILILLVCVAFIMVKTFSDKTNIVTTDECETFYWEHEESLNEVQHYIINHIEDLQMLDSYYVYPQQDDHCYVSCAITPSNLNQMVEHPQTIKAFSNIFEVVWDSIHIEFLKNPQESSDLDAKDYMYIEFTLNATDHVRSGVVWCNDNIFHQEYYGSGVHIKDNWYAYVYYYPD